MLVRDEDLERICSIADACFDLRDLRRAAREVIEAWAAGGGPDAAGSEISKLRKLVEKP